MDAGGKEEINGNHQLVKILGLSSFIPEELQFKVGFCSCTLPETNIAPENGGFQ